jgi:hypothetical protein
VSRQQNGIVSGLFSELQCFGGTSQQRQPVSYVRAPQAMGRQRGLGSRLPDHWNRFDPELRTSIASKPPRCQPVPRWLSTGPPCSRLHTAPHRPNNACRGLSMPLLLWPGISPPAAGLRRLHHLCHPQASCDAETAAANHRVVHARAACRQLLFSRSWASTSSTGARRSKHLNSSSLCHSRAR